MTTRVYTLGKLSLAFMYLVYSHPFGGLTGYLAFDIQLAPNTTSFQAPSATWPSPSSRHGLYFLLKALQLFCYAPKLLIPRQEGRHDKRHLTAYICVVKNLINQLGFSRRMRRRRIHGWRILPAARRCFTIKTLATRRISIAVAPRHLLFFAARESWHAMRGL